MAGLPKIGVEVVAVGVATFNRNMNDIMRSIVNVRRTTNALEQAGANSFGAFGAAASGAALIAGAAGVTITAALSAIITKSTEMAAQFEQTMAITGAIAEASASDMTNMASAAVDMSRKTTVSLNNIAEAMAELARAGLNMEDILGGATQAVLDLVVASGGELGLERAVLMVGGAINAFSLSGKEAASVANAMSTAALKSAISFADVQRSMQQASASAAMLGFTVQDTAAAIGILGLANIRGSDAGTSLKQMFLSLMAPSKQAVEMMQQYNIALFNGEEKALSFRTLIERLSTAFSDEAIAAGKVTEAQRAQALATIFGSDAIRAAIMLARFGTGVYDQFIETMEKLSAAELAAKILRPTSAQFGILKNQVLGLATVFGTDFNLAMGKAGRTLNFFIRQVDADVVKEFGRAFVAAMSNTDEIIKLPKKLKESPFADVFISWVQLARGLHQALVTRVIPAFINLFQVITGGQPITSLLASLLVKVTNVIEIGSRYLSYFINGVAAVIKLMNSWSVSAAALKVILSGLILLPFLGFINIILRMLAPFLALSSTAIAAAAAIYLIPKALTYLTTELQDSGSQVSKIMDMVINGFKIAAVAATIYAAVLAKVVITNILDSISTFRRGFAALWIALLTGAKGPFAQALAIITNSIYNVGKIIYTTFIPAVGVAIKNALRLALVMGTYLVMGVYRAIEAFIVLGVRGGIAFLRLTLVGRAATAAVAGLRLFTIGILGIVTSLGGFFPAILLTVSLLAVVGGAIYLLAKTWSDNFMNIRDVTKSVIDWVAAKIKSLFDFLAGLPLIGDALKWAGQGIKDIANWVGTALPKGIEAAKDAWDSLYTTAKPIIEGLAAEATKASKPILEMLGLTMPDQAKWDEEFAENEAAIERFRKEIIDLTSTFPELADATGGAGGASDELKKLTLIVGQLLKDIPAMTIDVAEFIAGLVQVEPSRMASLILTLRSASSILKEMVEAKKELLQTGLLIEQSEQRIAMLEARINVAQMQYQADILAMEQRLLALRMQTATVDAAILPLRNRARDIERQITLLQRENYELAVQRANIDLAAMPFRRELMLIERQIADIGDKRLDLAMREKQLIAEGALAQMEKDLKATNKALDEAWANQDVDEIIRLEALKAEQEKAVGDKQDSLDAIRNEQAEIERRNELARIGLEYEKLALEEILRGMDRKIEDIDYETELQQKRNAIILLALEKEKEALEDTIYTLELQKQAIEDTMAAIELQMQARELAYEQSVLQYNILLANEKILRAELELTKLQQEAALTALNLGFVDLMTVSGAYTVVEALEVSKRLGLWSEQMQAMAGIVTEYDNLTSAAINYTRALENLFRTAAGGGTAGGGSGGAGGIGTGTGTGGIIAPNFGGIGAVDQAFRGFGDTVNIAYDHVIDLSNLLARPNTPALESVGSLITKYGDMSTAIDDSAIAAVDFSVTTISAVNTITGPMIRAGEAASTLRDSITSSPATIIGPVDDISQAYSDLYTNINKSTEATKKLETQIIIDATPINRAVQSITDKFTSIKDIVEDGVIKAVDKYTAQGDTAYSNIVKEVEKVRAKYTEVEEKTNDSLTAVNTYANTTKTDIETIIRPTVETLNSTYDTVTSKINDASKAVSNFKTDTETSAAAIKDKVTTQVILIFNSLKDTVGKSSEAVIQLKKDIESIPNREIVIKIKYEEEGKPTDNPSLPKIPTYAHGGIVPGRWGEPIWVLAHGGERFLGINNTKPASTYNAGAARVAPVQNITNNTNYNVNASYSRVQSAASVSMDMRAMVGMTRR